MNRLFILFAVFALIFFVSCEENDDVTPGLAVPDTYAFEREGATSVSYSGQTDRLAMLAEITAYLKTADGGETISAQVLHDAFENTGDNGNGFFSFTSTKQLKDKTFVIDLDNNLFGGLFDAAAGASQSTETASDGVAGRLTRPNGKTILVDANGREFTQLIEKGLMGSVFLNQIFNTYLSEERTGASVDNTTIVEGKNYTKLEHHWDEAYGYFHSPVDFKSDWPDDRSSELRFWNKYSNVVDPLLTSNDAIFDGFVIGRTAIVNNDHSEKDTQKDVLFEQLEKVSAATCIHYINDAISALNNGDFGDVMHFLSEAWAFGNALKYSPKGKISSGEVETIIESDFGANGNFWNATSEGLTSAREKLATTYGLTDIQTEL